MRKYGEQMRKYGITASDIFSSYLRKGRARETNEN